MTEREAATKILRLREALALANDKLATVGESQVEPEQGTPDQYEDDRITYILETE